MRRALKIIAILLAVLVVASAVLFFSFRSEIEALITAVTHSEEELQQMQEETRQELQTQFETETGIDLAAIEAEVAEEAAAAESGEAPQPSETEPAPQNGETPEPPKPETTEKPGRNGRSSNTSDKEEPAQAQEEPKNSEEVEAVLKRFYQLQSSFVGQLNALPGRASSEFHSLPQEQWTPANKARVVRKYVGVAGSLEQQCDASVAALLGELRSALKNSGMDEGLAKNVEQYYLSAKQLQKAEFLSKYKNEIS